MIKIIKNSETFGVYIRKLRVEKGFGQRELAQKINIAASYLNDIEKNKRAAPKKELLKKISTILEIDLRALYDLAGSSKNKIAPVREITIPNISANLLMAKFINKLAVFLIFI